jgi:predicted benzoate:H+ symporter BenE
MNITQKQRISVEEIGVLLVFNIFASVPFVPVLCRLLCFSFLCYRVSPVSSVFLLLYCGCSTPAVMRKVSFSALNFFLPRHCGPDLR